MLNNNSIRKCLSMSVKMGQIRPTTVCQIRYRCTVYPNALHTVHSCTSIALICTGDNAGMLIQLHLLELQLKTNVLHIRLNSHTTFVMY